MVAKIYSIYIDFSNTITTTHINRCKNVVSTCWLLQIKTRLKTINFVLFCVCAFFPLFLREDKGYDSIVFINNSNDWLSIILTT